MTAGLLALGLLLHFINKYCLFINVIKRAFVYEALILFGVAASRLQIAYFGIYFSY